MNFPNGTTEHPINKSGKSKILVSVWDFGATHPQSERSHYLCNDHPAKMRPSLARAVLQIYGESPVLDPMAGIGTTLVEAALLGMDAIGVEYERKFVSQANKNIEHLGKLFPDKELGKASCIKGDARDLSCLNNPTVNSIVFSPPYCGVMDAKRHVGGIASRDRTLAKTALYSKDKNNLGNIRNYGKIGSIVFSPPYADVVRGNEEGPMATSTSDGWKSRKRARMFEGYSRNPNNIGNIGYSAHGESYLDEMLKVYTECFKVLKPGKFMVVVVKDIRRRGLTVPLGADTIKLLQTVGFDIFDIVVNKMHFLSFWQLTLAQKTQSKGIPMALRTHEYVIIATKAKR